MKYNRCSKKEAQCITLYNFIKIQILLTYYIAKKEINLSLTSDSDLRKAIT